MHSGGLASSCHGSLKRDNLFISRTVGGIARPKLERAKEALGDRWLGAIRPSSKLIQQKKQSPARNDYLFTCVFAHSTSIHPTKPADFISTTNQS
jgi:hypothetical protein